MKKVIHGQWLEFGEKLKGGDLWCASVVGDRFLWTVRKRINSSREEHKSKDNMGLEKFKLMTHVLRSNDGKLF